MRRPRAPNCSKVPPTFSLDLSNGKGCSRRDRAAVDWADKWRDLALFPVGRANPLRGLASLDLQSISNQDGFGGQRDERAK